MVQKDGPKGAKRGARSVEKGVGKVGFVGDYRVCRFWVGLGWVRHLSGHGYIILLPSVL